MSSEKNSSDKYTLPKIERLHPDPSQGLSDEQAAHLYESGYGNTVLDPLTKTDEQIIKENVFTFFNMVFIILAFFLLLVGSFSNMLFLGIVVVNTLIGIFQQLRSKRELSKLTIMAAPKAAVLRSGQWRKILSEKLVREDIIGLKIGDQIPADAIVINGSVSVNESMLTGESDAIEKKHGDTLLSGSFVVSGKCTAELIRVGAHSYSSKIAMQAKADEGTGQSEMMRSLDGLIKFIGFALIPIGVALFINQFVSQGIDIKDSVTKTVAALIGMIPEGLYLLTSVALALGVMRLAKRKTLVHRLSAIETLARVDVLCVDKTGTITSPEMVLENVEVINETYTQQQTDDIINAYYTVTDADNDTSKAIRKKYSEVINWNVTDKKPFDSTSKCSSVTFTSQGKFIVGAPEFVLGQDFELIKERVSVYSSEGKRVLLLAKEESTGPVPVALLVLSNPIRENAPETFGYFYEQNVAVKVISGDNPSTVSAVAAAAGIRGAEKYVDARTLTDDKMIDDAIEKFTVFGRVTPEQKRKFVNALQKHGHKVAMTGDGVNDVLALKDADCAVAMASGSEAASQVAQVVLMNNDFASMPAVVDEGRRVINNIQRSAALYLVKNILSFFLSVVTVFSDFPYPFQPIQLTVISAITIGIPSFILAIEPNRELVKGKFLPNVMKKALPGGLTNLIAVLGVELFAYYMQFSSDVLSTMSVVLMGYVGLLFIYYISKPVDTKRWILIGTLTAAFIAAIFVLGKFIGLVFLPGKCVLILILLLIVSTLCMFLLCRAFDKIGTVKIKHRKHA